MELVNWWKSLGIQSQIEVVRTFVMAIGTLATVAGGFFVYRNFKVNQKRLLTDRFSKAVEHLGTVSNKTVILGGIYALSKIAQDSPEYHWMAMKVIASFIRSKTLDFGSSTATMSESYPRVYLEVQEAITVIAQRDYRQDASDEILDLSGSLFVRANLTNANFRRINLKFANFGNTELEGVDFSEENLEEAVFYGADLSGAILEGAKFKGSRYSHETKFPVNFDPDTVDMKRA